jgi:hypothetical protein
MGKEPDRVRRHAPPNGHADLQRLETEIERSRRRVDAYVDELDRRRHRLLSVRRHPAAAIGVVAGAVLLAGGAAVLIARRRRPSHRARRQTSNLREALARMARHPERVASDGKSPWSRVLVAVAPIVMKAVADAALRRRSGPDGRRERPR